MSIELADYAEQAEKHLGEDGPVDTCWSNGPERWARELGCQGLNTGSVSSAERSARAGVNGWAYHEGTEGLRRGHIADWESEALGPTAANPHPRHVTAVTDVDGQRWRGIGSGTPSRKVAKQPATGGWNPRSILRGYFVPPTATSAHQLPKPAAPSGKLDPGAEYVVKRGDYLQRIAGQHGTTVRAILAANPPRRDGRSADFHIARANHIEVGQRIRLP